MAETAPEVSISAWDVKVRGSPRIICGTYGEIVRMLSSYGRAVVRYAPCGETVFQAVQAALQSAVTRAEAEQHLRQVEAAHNKKLQSNDSIAELFVSNITAILKAKTKRLKQHARRAKARAARSRSTLVHCRSWPEDLTATADEFQDWDQDIFMHVAMKVLAQHFQQAGLEVEVADGIRVWQLRDKVKKLIRNFGKIIGVQEYNVEETIY